MTILPTMRTITISLFLALLIALPAAAQSDRIETDRPGLVPSPYTVPMGTLQAELGALNGLYREEPGGGGVAGTNTTIFNFPLQFRYGLTPGLELRVSSNVYQFNSSSNPAFDSDGFADITAGIKYTIPAGTNVNVVVIPEVVIPVGEDQGRDPLRFGTDNVSFLTDFVARFDLGTSPVALSVKGGLDVRKIGVSDGSSKYYAFGRFAGRLSGDVNQSARLFVEGGFFPQFNDFANNRYGVLGIGAKFLAAPNVSFDIFGNRAFASTAPYDWGFGLGVSTRF